tara:strand:+ start:185 stop:433 length:249 start_codon:yes stop_codon:yes gene_type:complete
MNNEVERYVGELKELREKNKTLSERVKTLEEEVAWRTKYGDYINHQYIMASSTQPKKATKITMVEEDTSSRNYRNKYFSSAT